MGNTIDVLLQIGEAETKEMLPKMAIQYDHNNNILLQPLIEDIKNKRFPVRHHIISYYAASHRAYVFVDTDPISPNHVIPASDIDPNGRLTLKFRPQDHNATGAIDD
jgi:hypothetical protein